MIFLNQCRFFIVLIQVSLIFIYINYFSIKKSIMQTEQIKADAQFFQWNIAPFDQSSEPIYNDWQNMNYKKAQKRFFQVDQEFDRYSVLNVNNFHLQVKQFEVQYQNQPFTIKNKRQTCSTTSPYQEKNAIDQLLILSCQKDAINFDEFLGSDTNQIDHQRSQDIKNKLKEDLLVQVQKKNREKPLFLYERPRTRLIINVAGEIQRGYLKVINGTPDDTNRFQSNFKRINIKILKNISQSKNLDQNGQELYQSYKKSNSKNFTQTRKLFGFEQQSSLIDNKADRLRRQVNKVYSSSQFIKEILRTNTSMKLKILMFKFSDVFHDAVIEPENHYKWKKQRC